MSVFFLISFVFLCNNLFGDTTYSVNSSLVADERLSSSGTAATFSATVTLDGAKYIWTLPPVSTTPVITVQNGFTATLTNILLQYLLPSHISLGAGSNIVFGDGSIIYLGDSDSLNYTWGFSGTSALDGRAKTLTLGSNGVIEAQSGATLTLKDLTIYDVNATNLRSG